MPKHKVYVVAISRKEAEDLAAENGWATKEDAEAHLAYVRSPPTDPFYATQYSVREVETDTSLLPLRGRVGDPTR